jgi:hypothetical protein
MDHSNRDRTPADLSTIAERLREERPTATALELDRIKLRARSQAQRSATGFYALKKGSLMKSRLALMLMIVAGLTMSTTGATLAITGSSGSGSAAVNQYDTVAPQKDDGDQPQQDDGDQPQQDDGDQPEAGTLGTEDSGDDGDDGDTAPVAEQVEVAGDDDDSLPFTGFIAIPLLLGGVALVSAGAVLRRKAD